MNGCTPKANSDKQIPSVVAQEVVSTKHVPRSTQIQNALTAEVDELKDENLGKYCQVLARVLDSVPLAKGLRKNMDNRGYVGVTYQINRIVLGSNMCGKEVEDIVEKWLVKPFPW